MDKKLGRQINNRIPSRLTALDQQQFVRILSFLHDKLKRMVTHGKRINKLNGMVSYWLNRVLIHVPKGNTWWLSVSRISAYDYTPIVVFPTNIVKIIVEFPLSDQLQRFQAEDFDEPRIIRYAVEINNEVQ